MLTFFMPCFIMEKSLRKGKYISKKTEIVLEVSLKLSIFANNINTFQPYLNYEFH